ncbi:MAG: hypothetical protein BM564_06225 [Bacteroidetes bacterium MedPE-SWsnd-G2]|nr:MAG: hypothetical protein BM564_06225 [Bacteroidetes bacterium MedPE-SWsnd-G2]
MRKDIEIPVVEGVYVAVVSEFNDVYKTQDWNAYIINDKEVPIDMVLIISTGYDDQKITSTMRHKLEVLPPKSYGKIELMQEDVLTLTNNFLVTFFEGYKMFEKTYSFPKNSINQKALQSVPLMDVKGVLVK